MPEISGYTQAQKDKIAKAQGRLDNAKANYSTWVTSYNDSVASIQPCYKDVIQDAGAASSWYNPQKQPCSNQGKDCKQSDVKVCKDVIEVLNGTTIPALRAAFNERNDAQANFTQVLNEVAAEAKNDPLNQAAHDAAVAAADEAENTEQRKWIFWTSVVVVGGFLIFAYFKWFRKVAPVAG